MGIVLGCMPVVGLAVSSYGLHRAFRAVDDKTVDPSQKATELAKGIDMAMYAPWIFYALGMVGGMLIVASLIWRSASDKK